MVENISKSEDSLFKLIFSNSSSGIAIYNERKNLTKVNHSCLELFGLSDKKEIRKLKLLAEKNISKIKLIELNQGETVSYEKLVNFDIFKKEISLNTKKSGEIYICVLITPLFFGENEIISKYLIQIQDITERKLLERNHKEIKEKYQLIVENTQEGIWAIDINANTTYVNNRMAEMLGYSKGEMLGRHLFSFMDERMIKIAKNKLENRKKGIKEQHDFEFLKKEGEKIYSIVETSPLIDEEGKYNGALAFVSDITERKKAEQRLKESEKRYRTIFEQSPDGIVILDLDSMKAVEFNDSICDILGYTRSEFTELTVPEYDLTENISDTRRHMDEILKGGKDNFETKMITKKGEIKDIYVTAKPIKLGKKIYFQSIFRDISERKKAERKYRSIFEAGSDAHIIVKEETLQILDVNQAAEKLYGYSRKEFKSMKASALSAEVKKTVKSIHKFSQERKKLKVKETRLHRKKDGTIFPVEITANHITLEGQQVNISSIRDITEREKAEQKLLESQKKYHELFNNINSGVAVYEAYNQGEDFIFKDFNLAASRIENVKRDDLIGKKVTEVFPGVKKFGIFKVFQRVWETGEAEFQPVKLYKDERVKGWRESYVYKLPSGEIVAVYDEVSDRVIAQQKMKESEELFRSTFEQAAVGIAHLSPNGNFLRINQKLCDILKYSYDELLSLTFRDITHPSDIEDNLVASDKLLSGELASYNTEKRYICGDGTYLWANLTVSVKRDKRENPEYFISVIQDISERKKAKQKLKESENKFRTIAEQTSIGIAIFQKGNIKYLNQAYADIYEYDINEISTWKINEMLRNIYIEDLPKIEGIIKQRKLDKVKTITYTTRINTKNGEIKWVEVFSREIIYQNEKAILITTIDITDKKEIEKRLKELDKIKSEFISRTSHELKTPLVSIKGYVNLFLDMQSKDLDSQSISILKEINHGCDRLESLIKDLLETSRLETKGLELKKERENLGFLIKYSINDLLGLINQRKHNVAVDLHENMNTMFEKERIYQVIINLLSNAINYTPPNGTLEIKSEIKDDHYVISIKDSGIGLTEDEKKKIFKKFGKIERYGQGFDVISEGTGLGLYISKKVIELHGGKIWVKSEGRNKGSTFSFSLPIVKN